MRKRIVSCAMAFLMVFTLMPCSAFAGEASAEGQAESLEAERPAEDDAFGEGGLDNAFFAEDADSLIGTLEADEESAAFAVSAVTGIYLDQTHGDDANDGLTKDTAVQTIAKANELAEEIPNSFIAGQFTNPVNPATHKATTGPEIWNDTEGKVDIFIAGVGTGGTLSGVGEYLKSKNPDVKIVAVEPATSPVLSKGTAGPHKIQGIGAGFVPDTLNTKIYDEIITVENEDAFATGKAFPKQEGVLVGISSGAALWAAKELAKRPENKGKTIVALLPDTGDRYLSTPLFSE